MTEITQPGPSAGRNSLYNAGEAGNLSVADRGAVEVVELGQNELATTCRIPKNAVLLGCHYSNDALGANTALKFGFQHADGQTEDLDAFGTVADASSASAGTLWCAPTLTTAESVCTVQQTGTGEATGTITAQPIYVFRHGD